MMKTNQTAAKTIDEYIAACPPDVQELLKQIRMTIKEAAPDTEETISYNMPTFTLNGHYLVYFAAFKKHIGFYPAPVGNAEFEADLSGYESGKGTVKFPLDQPIPFDLIRKIVQFRARENAGRAAATERKK
jgi:uncharacterized protein YdhG (YjbR/CyaY superfamily)